MSEHTPTTEEVRQQYTREQPPHVGTVSSKSAEFDRWLAGIRAQAWEEGQASGAAYGDTHNSMHANPYRQATP